MPSALVAHRPPVLQVPAARGPEPPGHADAGVQRPLRDVPPVGDAPRLRRTRPDVELLVVGPGDPAAPARAPATALGPVGDATNARRRGRAHALRLLAQWRSGP